MKVTPAVIQRNLIGLKARITHSSNHNQVGITGIVVNETRNTFTLMQNKERKTIAKDQAVFHFTMPDTTVVEMDGKTLVGKPEERLKKRIRRLW